MAQSTTGMKEEQTSSEIKVLNNSTVYLDLQLHTNIFGSRRVTDDNDDCQGRFLCRAQGGPFAARGQSHRELQDCGWVFEHSEDAAWKMGG